MRLLRAAEARTELGLEEAVPVEKKAEAAGCRAC